MRIQLWHNEFWQTYSFTDGLTEVNPEFWTVPVTIRDQFDVLVPDGKLHIRYADDSPFTTGEIITFPKDITAQVRSEQKSLKATYAQTTFIDGLTEMPGQFRSVLFQAVGSDNSTLVPGVEIEIDKSNISRFAGNTRASIPFNDTIEVQAYLSGIQIGKESNVSVQSTTNTIIIPTTWEPPISNNNPEITSGPLATPNPAEVNTLVSFNVASTDPDENPLSCSWDFGNGFAGIGNNPSHTYLSTGTYTATVRVTDGQ